MEFLNIIGSISIKPDWANITGAVLKAGTPLSITGVVANNANAIGLLAADAQKGDNEVNVVYAGLVDIGEVEASYGDSLADDCKSALKGITIVDTSGSPVVPSGGGLPDYSEASDGDVLGISSGEPGWVTPDGGGVFAFKVTYYEGYEVTCNKTANEILAAYKAGKTMVCTINYEALGDAAPALAAIRTNSAGTQLTRVYAMSAYLSLPNPDFGDPAALNVAEAIYNGGEWTVNYANIYSAAGQ
jgi:hypothetical protein